MTRTIETAGPVKLYVEIGRGRLEATAADTANSAADAASEPGQTTIELSGPGAGETEVVQDGDQISIIGPRQRAGFLGGDRAVQVEVTVPTGSQLIARTGSADQVVRGTWTMVRSRTGSGDVEVAHVTGPTTVESGSGDTIVARAEGDVRVKSGSGDVHLAALAASAVVSTGSGDVSLGETGGTTVVKTGSGDVVVADSRADLSVSTGSGDAAVRLQHRGSVTTKSASGSVRIGVPGGIPVWTDVSTISGRLHSTLEGAGQPADGEDHIEIRVTSASGDISLEQR
jgi:DUF4097 and DUF4098 domain-containing protein YvlB